MDISKAKILYKLAKHLQKPQEQLGNDYFNFQTFGATYGTCTTLACAIGEMPYCFPNEFEVIEKPHLFKDNLFEGKKLSFCVVSIIHKENFLNITQEDEGSVYFGIEEHEYEHLFIPSHEESEIAHVNRLGNNATKDEVAQNIINFLTKHKGFSIKELEQ